MNVFAGPATPQEFPAMTREPSGASAKFQPVEMSLLNNV